MSAVRRLALEQARQAVIRAARFRRPQRDAFDVLHNLLLSLDDRMSLLDRDRFLEQVREHGIHVRDNRSPYLVFALATGVGKTRLAGGIIAYLALARESRNVVILSPRAAVLEKFEREVLSTSDKYLLLDPSLVAEPHVCTRGNLEDFEPSSDALNIFVLSPQSLTGGDRRIARRREFAGGSILEYLKAREDLVVITDEAHHIGVASQDANPAWTEAIEGLLPRLHVGLTATPRDDAGGHTAYQYSLATCLQEKLYTKDVRLLVRNNEHGIPDEDWDRVTVDYALTRLSRKRQALREYADAHPEFAYVEPVLLIAARDTQHAEEVSAWLKEHRQLTDEELLVTHSERRLSEAEIARLVAIDQPGNRVRVVVNVHRLMEGWDVTNVYVIAPLRAMATFAGAVQSLGRGLRLPAGRRVGERELDTLDLVCFGRATLEELVSEAMAEFGDRTAQDPGIAVLDAEEDADGEPRDHPFILQPVRGVSLTVPVVQREFDEPDLNFRVPVTAALLEDIVGAIDLGSLQTIDPGDQGARYDAEDIVRIAANRVLAELSYLSPLADLGAVRALVRQVVAAVAPGAESSLALDPVRVALVVKEEIARRYRSRQPRYIASDGAEVLALGERRLLVPASRAAGVPRSSAGGWT